jgi:nucleoredoxin
MSGLEALVGKEVINNKGEKVSVSSLSGKTIGLYFSAHWCPPCRGFTPKLAEFYTNDLKNKNLEIIFVSSDRDKESFDEYFAEMPWLALPYEDRKAKSTLSAKFKIEGIPSFVILDSDGNLITKNGREAVMRDPQGNNLPWKPKTIVETLGTSFQGKTGTVSIDQLKQADAVGIYFSAHWCPPCRGFTPKFAEAYNKLKANGKKFEVVFVSSDRDQKSFDDYYAEMPWLAVPFDDKDRIEELGSVFEVQGIPHLAIIDPKTGKIITGNGRAAIASDPEGKEFPWHPKPLKRLSAATDYFNDMPVMIVFADDEATHKTIEKIANEFAAEFKTKGEDEPIIFAYASNTDGELAERVSDFMQLPEKKPLAVIMNIPDESKIISEEVTESSLRQLVKDFLAGKLESIPLQA